jgi:polyisoprenoid-binding protein YceI
MKSKGKIKAFILLAVYFIVSTTYAQEKYKLVQDKSKLIVKGTSSVHDWEMNASDLKSEILVSFSKENILKFDEVSFSCPAKMILSNNSIMDNKTHNALKASEHPVISFKMESISINRTEGKDFSGEIYGNVKIAGVSKPIKLKFSGNISDKSIIKVKGIVSMKMSDFEIIPPTAMLGALKTGNDVEVEYEFYFNKI